ncbi:hypothetical protein [Gandjariella thermophila]|uniref:Uncharacterized protein n=1 Tax=Gandjariella thermophila TaxID=1931992 RepID=A0A4D4JEC4_9PSEU|nr:hypothetical protein [Gandjariella thermophila]GDY32203.1 hypothetical protein GTS_38360 [Gandjariella thermophila]
MEALSPALVGVFSRLRNDLYRYLDGVEELARDGEDDEFLNARADVETLVGCVRTLLAEHRPDADGCCAVCPPGGIGWRYGRSPWPCPVVNTVYRFLEAPHRALIEKEFADEWGHSSASSRAR